MCDYYVVSWFCQQGSSREKAVGNGILQKSHPEVGFYSDSLLPRGLVGRLDKILGCRALTLLMDAAGDPLLVETARGDQHLTIGAPAIIERYEQAAGNGKLSKIIIDREGMSGEFLKSLCERRTFITLLRSNQYKGLNSFSNVGDFSPLEFDRNGKVIREVAPAQFALSISE